MRSSTADVFETLARPLELGLELAMEFCAEDECVEVTPEVDFSPRGRSSSTTTRAVPRSRANLPALALTGRPAAGAPMPFSELGHRDPHPPCCALVRSSAPTVPAHCATALMSPSRNLPRHLASSNTARGRRDRQCSTKTTGVRFRFPCMLGDARADNLYDVGDSTGRLDDVHLLRHDGLFVARAPA